MLEQSDIAHYLLSLGVVKPRSVVEEDLTIVDASRRNRVFVASTRDGPAYVVKQAGRDGAASLAHEIAVLRELARAGALADRIPTVVHHDPDTALAVLSTQADARDWTAHFRRRFPVLGPRALGRALATLHGIRAEGPPLYDHLWPLQLTQPSREMLLGMSSGAQELVARLQADRSLGEGLDAVRGTVAVDGFVHGDVRWDNCLAVGRRGSGILLVDWEFAGPGPPAVDVGAALAEFLAAWIESVPFTDPRDPGRLLGLASRPLRRMQPAMRAFWTAYRNARHNPPSLRSVVQLAALRLLQTSVERAQQLVSPTAHVVAHAQLAANMLRQPEDAAHRLLGFHEA